MPASICINTVSMHTTERSLQITISTINLPISLEISKFKGELCKLYIITLLFKSRFTLYNGKTTVDKIRFTKGDQRKMIINLSTHVLPSWP